MKNNDALYLTIPLIKSIKKDIDYGGNYLVYGQGGFGKTTSMLLLFKYFLSKAHNGENIVPIYIDSKGLDFTYDKPVFEYIIREYCGFNRDISQHIETLNDLLKTSNKKYYIIIDAINEAESNKFKVIYDIASLKEIFDKNHKGKIIVSSRTDENFSCFNDFKRLKMLDFTDKQIVDFLNKYDFKNNGKPIDKIDVERIDKNLLKILRAPMFLKIFRDVYKDANVFPDIYKKNIIRESDLLSKFVDKIINDKIGMHKAENSPEYIKCFFALKRFLPALAFELAKNDDFSINESVLDDLLENKFNESYFKQFQNRRENYFKFAGDLNDLLNDCIDDFSFIVCKGENKNTEYSFSHQVWRDYFAAVYLKNSIDYDVTDGFEYQISDNIQQYTGEIIKEYEFENKTDTLSPMSPIEAFMQRNCNVLSPLAVRLCIGIMKKSRNGKLTAKYNNLDLKYINFYDYNLKGSSFGNSKVYEHNFIPQGHTGSVNSVCYSPDGKRIISGGDLGTISIWNAATGEEICTLHEERIGLFLESRGKNREKINSLCYSPNGKIIISGNASGTISIYDAQIGEQKGETFEGHTGSVNSVCCFSDGKRIVSGSDDATIRIWDAETGEQIGEPLEGHIDSVNSVSYSPNENRIVSGSNDGTVRIWNAETGEQIGEPLEGHTDSVNSVCYSPNGKQIVSGSNDGTVRIWNAATGEQLWESFKGRIDLVNSVCYSPDGKRIVSGNLDETIRIWNVETGKQIGEPLEGHTDSVNSVCYSPDGKRIVSGSDDAIIRIWDTETGEQIGEPFKGHTGSVYSVSYSSDGERIVSGGYRTIRIWNAETGEQIGEPFKGHTGSVYSVSYSPDRKRIVSGSWDETICFWNAEKGKQIGASLGGRIGTIYSVSYSPNSERIVSGDSYGTIRIWDAETGEQIGEPFKGHIGSVYSVSYSSDGNRIVSGSGDKTIRIWDAETGTQIGEPLEGHTGEVISVCCSLDGKRIVSGSNDGTVRIWNLETHLCTVLKGIIQSNIQKCDFRNAIFDSKDINDFCHILYCNGADVPKEYEPKLIPFEWNGEESDDKESE